MANSRRNKGKDASFRLKESPSEEKTIRLDYSYGKRFRYSIGYSVNPIYWDVAKQQVKQVKAVSNAVEINKLIRDLKSELLRFVSECDSKQILISNPLLKKHLDSFTKKDVKTPIITEKATTFFPFIKKHIELKEKQLPKGKNGRKNSTIKSYEQTYRHLKEFQSYAGYEMTFESIDNEFYSEFVDYMNQKTWGKDKKPYALNTIGKQIKTLKSFMNASIDEGLHVNLKYKKFKDLKEITTAIFLNLDELKKLYELDLKEKHHYELARDIFLIGCEIGQRISDYHNLQIHEIVNFSEVRYIKIKQEKTKKEVLCRITPVIEKIMIERYDGKLPPKIAEQKLNSYIKIIGEMAGLNNQIKCEITRGGGREVEYIPKYKLIMGHTARRTFCTLKYKSQVPVHSIMELSGHSTVKEFMKYIRNPKEERVSQITELEAFKNSCIIV